MNLSGHADKARCCRCTMELFWGRCCFWNGYHVVARETGKEFVPQISPMCVFCFVSFFLVCEFRSMFSDVFGLHCYIGNPYTLLKFETIGKFRPFNCSWKPFSSGFLRQLHIFVSIYCWLIQKISFADWILQSPFGTESTVIRLKHSFNSWLSALLTAFPSASRCRSSSFCRISRCRWRSQPSKLADLKNFLRLRKGNKNKQFLVWKKSKKCRVNKCRQNIMKKLVAQKLYCSEIQSNLRKRPPLSDGHFFFVPVDKKSIPRHWLL